MDVFAVTMTPVGASSVPTSRIKELVWQCVTLYCQVEWSVHPCEHRAKSSPAASTSSLKTAILMTTTAAIDYVGSLDQSGASHVISAEAPSKSSWCSWDGHQDAIYWLWSLWGRTQCCGCEFIPRPRKCYWIGGRWDNPIARELCRVASRPFKQKLPRCCRCWSPSTFV